MDLNEKLAARRKELADEEERVRREAAMARQAALQAEREAALAAQAEKAANLPPDPINLQALASKSVDIDADVELFKQAVERTTMIQLVIFCIMGLLAIVGVIMDVRMAIFWAICALVYLAVILSNHMQAIKNPAGDKQQSQGQ